MARICGAAHPPWSARLGYTTINLAGAALIWLAVQQHPLLRLLAWRPLAALGTISYALYVYHLPLQTAITTAHGGLYGPHRHLILLAYLAVLLLLAVISDRLLEQPFLRLKERLAGRTKTFAGSGA